MIITRTPVSSDFAPDPEKLHYRLFGNVFCPPVTPRQMDIFIRKCMFAGFYALRKERVRSLSLRTGYHSKSFLNKKPEQVVSLSYHYPDNKVTCRWEPRLFKDVVKAEDCFYIGYKNGRLEKKSFTRWCNVRLLLSGTRITLKQAPVYLDAPVLSTFAKYILERGF